MSLYTFLRLSFKAVYRYGLYSFFTHSVICSYVYAHILFVLYVSKFLYSSPCLIVYDVITIVYSNALLLTLSCFWCRFFLWSFHLSLIIISVFSVVNRSADKNKAVFINLFTYSSELQNNCRISWQERYFARSTYIVDAAALFSNLRI